MLALVGEYIGLGVEQLRETHSLPGRSTHVRSLVEGAAVVDHVIATEVVDQDQDDAWLVRRAAPGAEGEEETDKFLQEVERF